MMIAPQQYEILGGLACVLGTGYFHVPADEEMIAEAEAAFEPLPPVLRAMWAESRTSRPLREDGLRLLEPRESIEAWQTQLDYARQEGVLDDEQIHGPCHQKVFDARWVPFAADEEMDHLYCLDGHPSPEGTLHQVILVHHLEGLFERVAESLEAFFDDLADEVASERDAAETTARVAELGPAVEQELARYRAAGVELGSADDLAVDPTMVVGHDGGWTPADHGTRLFLERVDGLHFRGLVGQQAWLDYSVRTVSSWGERGGDLADSLGPYIESMGPSWDTCSPIARGDQIVGEINRLLESIGDCRRLWAPAGKGTPYAMRCVLLTPEQKGNLEAAGLVAFKANTPRSSNPPDDGRSKGILGRLRRLFR